VPLSLSYGALLGLLSRLSPFKVRRNDEKCIHCHAAQITAFVIDVENTAVVNPKNVRLHDLREPLPADGAIDLTVRAGNKIATVNPWFFP